MRTDRSRTRWERGRFLRVGRLRLGLREYGQSWSEGEREPREVNPGVTLLLRGAYREVGERGGLRIAHRRSGPQGWRTRRGEVVHSVELSLRRAPAYLVTAEVLR
ncbi:MAG TPA: hypothetical protein VFV36_10280 [Candidatus Methylomirabilis sp.]|nr:hypothetical protein [Candidatus Methylomirabilis sp.]